MTNDVFGHTAGDELLKKVAAILLRSCSENDIVARLGGDEFIILLPKTNAENVSKILSRIRSRFLNERVAAIKCSISLGSDTKTNSEYFLDEIIANAENAMYKDKTLNRKSIQENIIDTIMETLHTRNPSEKRHSLAVSELCGEAGKALHLSETGIDKLKRAGYLHDIGKITLDDSILSKDFLSEEEREKMHQHPVVGYRILNLFDSTLGLAEYVYSHHERWDGTGYPRGLKGKQIPLISRIVSIVEGYERALNKKGLSLEERKTAAINKIVEGANTQFDPQIVVLFARMIEGKRKQEG